jgi:hypothetical protein
MTDEPAPSGRPVRRTPWFIPELGDAEWLRSQHHATRLGRPRSRHGVAGRTRWVLRTVAKRAIALEAEVKEIDAILKDLVAETAPELLARSGLGTDTTSAVLVAAGDNPPTATKRGIVRSRLRRRSHRRVQGKERTTPPQPRRRPPSQLRSLAHRHHPHRLRPNNTRIHRTSHHRRPHQERSHPLPQTPHRTRDLPPPPQARTRPLTSLGASIWGTHAGRSAGACEIVRVLR